MLEKIKIIIDVFAIAFALATLFFLVIFGMGVIEGGKGVGNLIWGEMKAEYTPEKWASIQKDLIVGFIGTIVSYVFFRIFRRKG